ncbi:MULTISPECIES: MotA/TolQ/ExbB proton channel family protein [unclassified Mucilaginibacter]|uniref:MotA/TolQ/ExbB proton channel family protein n=1 Tax=unclassified Mucilaginibacter TaxID=2617802 RepID=UPI002AC92953|nr:MULTISPECIES: MotA/TolQ/ExbB proton channel family protein [unclassified Mucilaginibacter]MEB0263966.1 MotA/TolQ/ExbB proton channel family protein [Mucilaginibacter sp. 10I4]MEB0279832.1 MotA/TolQ/ExbB proton channel family protein [Mucilaginibacter sp. 10B2]MEB0303246.1 MotA/TolQ/ExbB proton channel family protein [Mucilaginibacter sp. 5C4]WPX24196.1 MotA/TolQ/ExbB proton channel family protein [Mucilaginibacter sp. 5C4]
MANAPTKPTTPVKESSSASGAFATLTIPICIVVAILIFVFILGHPSHYKGGDPANEPNPGDLFGTVHKGGVIVPLIMSYLLMVIVFSIERFVVIGKASGTGNVDAFVRKIQSLLNAGNIDGASAECDKQKGSVANVIKSGLKKYKEMEFDQTLDVEQKALAIQKDIEEATALEMPMLEQNLTIIATLVSIGTLTGLLGTVIGMIKAFGELAAAGAPNQSALSNSISEALINTALGIGTSAVSIVMYNLFTSKIDKLTYAIDETGFSIVQTFAASHKK